MRDAEYVPVRIAQVAGAVQSVNGHAPSSAFSGRRRAALVGAAVLCAGFALLVLESRARPPSWRSTHRRGFLAEPEHFAPPNAQLWGETHKQGAPLPTGAWWLNAVLGEGETPVPATPYQVAVTGQGVGVSYSARRRDASVSAQLDRFGVDWLALSKKAKPGGSVRLASSAEAAVAAFSEEFSEGGFVAAGDALGSAGFVAPQNRSLSAWSRLGASVRYDSGASVLLVKGSPFVTFELEHGAALVLAAGAATGGRVASFASQVATMADGSRWMVHASRGVEVSLGDEGCALAFDFAGESGVGVVQLSFVPSDAALALLRAAAGTYATGGEVVFDEKDAAQFALAWTVKRADESSPPVHHLATLALPHHRETLQSPAASTLVRSGFVCAKGEMTWALGDRWTLRETLPELAELSSSDSYVAVGAAQAETIAKQAKRDLQQLRDQPSPLAHKGGYGDLYFEGKELGRLARLAVVCDAVGDRATSRLALRFLQQRFERWLEREDVLAVDATWGGVVSRAGYPASVLGGEGQPFANYGNALYSDHHFQFGYFVYAAATLERLGTTQRDGAGFAREWAARVRELVYDYANPPASSGDSDARFPEAGRHKDWYESHSWASGLVAYETGKSQESSSEAAHGYYAVALLGDAQGDARLRDWGRLLLATELRGAHLYWQMAHDTEVYDPVFAQNRFAGSVAGFSAIATTWFGSNPEYVHGINVLPVVAGLTEYTLRPKFVCDEYPVFARALARESTPATKEEKHLSRFCRFRKYHDPKGVSFEPILVKQTQTLRTLVSIFAKHAFLKVQKCPGSHSIRKASVSKERDRDEARVGERKRSVSFDSLNISLRSQLDCFEWTSLRAREIAAESAAEKCDCTCRPPAPAVGEGWRGFAYADLAVLRPEAAWRLTQDLNELLFDDGGSKANLLHWIATRLANASRLDCDLEAQMHNNATDLPWDVEEMQHEGCEANPACFALGLSGLCCPQADGYMFGCCPVLKSEALETPKRRR